MSYSFPTKKYPIGADVDALATFLAQRQSDSATTNGGIVASGGSPTVPQMGVDAAGLGLAYLEGMADALLCASGFQAKGSITGISSNTTTSTTFVDVPGMSWTFTAPIAKNYSVDADALFFFTAGANPFGQVRLVINGDAGPAVTIHTVTLNLLLPIHMMHAASCAAGANTIKVQWSVNVNTYTMGVNANSYVNWLARG